MRRPSGDQMAPLKIRRAVLDVVAEYEPAVSDCESTLLAVPLESPATNAPPGVTYRISRPSGDQRGWNSSVPSSLVSGRATVSPTARTKIRMPVAVPAA